MPGAALTPVEISRALRAGMKGLGTDESKVIQTVANASNNALVQARTEYANEFHRDLEADIKSETSGNFEDTLVTAITPLAVLDARNIQAAMRGVGTDEDRLDEVLLFRNAAEITAIKAAYTAEFKKDLLAEIKSETSGHLRDIYVAALTTKNALSSPDEAEQLADQLHAAGEGRLGTDDGVFARIFGSSEPQLIEAIQHVYIMKYQKSLQEVLESEFGVLDRKDFRRCLHNALLGHGRFIGHRLKKSMERLGTDDRMLQRLIICHRSTGALWGANNFLIDNTGKSLVKWISDETSGDYRKCLIAFCRSVGV